MVDMAIPRTRGWSVGGSIKLGFSPAGGNMAGMEVMSKVNDDEPDEPEVIGYAVAIFLYFFPRRGARVLDVVVLLLAASCESGVFNSSPTSAALERTHFPTQRICLLVCVVDRVFADVYRPEVCLLWGEGEKGQRRW